jgi:hypothetical protein
MGLSGARPLLGLLLACMHVCMHAQHDACMCMIACMHACMCLHMHAAAACVVMHVRAWVMHGHAYVTCVHMCMHVRACAGMCVQTHQGTH